MPTVLSTYKNRLINLNSRNRNLFLPRLNKFQYLDLHSVDFLNGKPSFSLVRDLIGRKKGIHILPVSDPRDEKSNKISNQITQLTRQEKFVHEETGVGNLYVGWPFVSGKFSNNLPIHAPFLLFPVRLFQEKGMWQLQETDAGRCFINPSFLLAYWHFSGVSVSERLMNDDFEELSTDAVKFRTELYDYIKNEHFGINFNTEIFADKLLGFPDLRKQEFVEKAGTGELKLMPYAVLGIYAQSNAAMINDYDSLLCKASDIGEVFDRFTQVDHTKKQLREAQLIPAFECDTSQEQAMNMVKSGRSIVVQGPPGSGKSQLICNLVSDFVARGKTVLVVSQKRVALDVVKERLRTVGLEHFSVLVHDHNLDRRHVFKQIESQIGMVPEYRRQNNTLDGILIERDFQQISKRTDKVLEELEEFRQALYSTAECGWSAKELYLSAGAKSRLKFDIQHLPDRKDWENLKPKLCDILAIQNQIGENGAPWHERVSFAHFGMEDKWAIEGLVPIVATEINEAREALQAVIGKETDELYYLVDKVPELRSIEAQLEAPSVYEKFSLVSKNRKASESKLSTWQTALRACFKNPGIDLATPTHELGALQDALEKRRSRWKNPYRFYQWMRDKRGQVLLRGAMAKTKAMDLEAYGNLLDHRLNLEDNRTRMKATGWFANLPTEINEGSVENYFSEYRTAFSIKKTFSNILNLNHHLDSGKLQHSDFLNRLGRMTDILDTMHEKWAQWGKYLPEKQIKTLGDNPGLVPILLRSLEINFHYLCVQDQILSGFTQAELEVYRSFPPITHDVESEINIVEKGLKNLWLLRLEKKYPVLQWATGSKLDLLASELNTLKQKKRDVVCQLMMIRAREKTYTALQQNRLKNTITYQDLLYQVTKKRKLWPLRKLIAEHGEDLLRIVPCWLASPETVSAVFPTSPVFDLVIFDEASQCYAERGMPAILRGAQVVVLGDKMQLQPSDLYRIRLDGEDEDDLPDLEAESLLELAHRYFPEVSLKEHYRSIYPELLAFSNHNFYKGMLHFIPPAKRNDPSPAIEYHKIDGHWDKQTNKSEAEHIVSLLTDLKDRFPKKSIGVITFNFPQQVLIQELIGKKLGETGKELSNDLFVKNLENVQGDERDIIVFSIGYAPKAKGNIQMQFGLLSQAGGENRLNVAITRAREKMIIVASIWPEDMKTAHLVNEGPRVLQAFLEYARQVSNGNMPKGFSGSKTPTGLAKKIMAEIKDTYSASFADVVHPAKKAVFLTDDDGLYGAPSVKDFFLNRPSGLEKKGWKAGFAFSRDFWLNH